MKNTMVCHFGNYDQLEVELEIDCDWVEFDGGYFDVNDYTILVVTWYSPQDTDYWVSFTPDRGSWMDIFVRGLIDKHVDLEKEVSCLDWS